MLFIKGLNLFLLYILNMETYKKYQTTYLDKYFKYMITIFCCLLYWLYINVYFYCENNFDIVIALNITSIVFSFYFLTKSTIVFLSVKKVMKLLKKKAKFNKGNISDKEIKDFIEKL